jgi:hypothetical protein
MKSLVRHPINPQQYIQLSLRSQESKTAWVLILVLALIMALGIIIGVGSINGILFPFSFLTIGYLLYRRFPHMYVSFTLWTWFIGAVIYRLIEYRGLNTTIGDTLTVPRLVTAISLLSLIRYLPKSLKNGGMPFLMCSGSICYGFIIDFVQYPQNYSNPASLVNNILLFFGWIGPIAFGFHLFINWRDYPIYRQTILKTYLWCVLILGVYGLWQYFATPPWDSLDLDSIERLWMGGQDKEGGLRVWSTMGQTYAFTFNFFPGLLLLFIQKSPLRFLGFGVGSLTFLISRLRTAWLSFSISFLCFFLSSKSNTQLKTIVTIIVFILFIVPLLFYFSDSLTSVLTTISSRFQSFSNSEDGSLMARKEFYERNFNYAISEFVGKGIDLGGKVGFSLGENGVMEILSSIGWLGTTFFAIGLISIITLLYQSPAHHDVFFIAARAIIVGSLAKMFISSFLFDEFAMPIWGFIGIAMAAHKYYIYQLSNKIPSLNS